MTNWKRLITAISIVLLVVLSGFSQIPLDQKPPIDPKITVGVTSKRS